MRADSILTHGHHAQRGATLAEFVIVAPLVLLIGMTTVQAALIYHGKTTLNYATFEAARTGATNNAQLALMRKELGLRLAPLEGGDGSVSRAALAVAKSSIAVRDEINTQIRVLNPTTAAFEDWGIDSSESNRRVLPNNHLRHREHTIGETSGLSLRDANLLRIEVTHGVDLRVPFVNTLISRAMMLVDPDNAIYYTRGKFPVQSVATVRMQSEAWEEEVVLANTPPAGGAESEEGNGHVGQVANTPRPEWETTGQSEQQAGEQPEEVCENDGLYGLGISPVVLNTSELNVDECSGSNPAFEDPESPFNRCE